MKEEEALTFTRNESRRDLHREEKSKKKGEKLHITRRRRDVNFARVHYTLFSQSVIPRFAQPPSVISGVTGIIM